MACLPHNVCLTRRSLSTAAVFLAILAMLTPWVVDTCVAIHMALDAHHGHDGEPHDDMPQVPGSIHHGHAHRDGTPSHDHGSSLPEGASRPLRAPTVTWTPGALAIPQPDGATWRLAEPAAIEPSPPIVTTTILRT